MIGDVWVVAMAFLASQGFLEAQEQPRGSHRGSGRPREAQGDPRSSSEMSGASFRKISLFGPGRRLAASEGPKIAQIGSLARMKKVLLLARSRAPACSESFFIRASEAGRRK